MQVFRRLSAFRGDSALSTWLHRIAVNTVLMHFRKRVLHQVSLDERSESDSKTLRREYGGKDGRLFGTIDRIVNSRTRTRGSGKLMDEEPCSSPSQTIAAGFPSHALVCPLSQFLN